ncbi:MAG: ABC transporter permease [Bacteroidota bacterium]
MWKHYFKTAFRHMLKHKMHSTIKMGGLAIGIGACILLVLFILNELSYDKYYEKTDQIYRVTVNYLEDGTAGVDFPAPLAKTLVNDFPEIERAGRYIPAKWFNVVRPEDEVQNVHEEKFVYMDQELLEILEIEMEDGSLAGALSYPNTALITKSKADKFFPNENPVGKTLIFNENRANPFIIKGVVKDFPNTSHLDFDFLLSLEGVEFWEGEQNYWGANMYDVYVLLRPGSNIEEVNRKLSQVTSDYFLPSWRERGFVNPEKIAENMQFELQPVTDIFIAEKQIRDGLRHGDMRLIWLYGAAVLFILFIACINFINLSTAKSVNRSREVGISKAIGAHRQQLATQFLVESILYSFLSVVLGLLFAISALPYFNLLSQKNLEIPFLELWFIPSIILFALFVGILTGLYPSLYLSSFSPINAIKSRLKLSKANNLLRRVLVVFQFTTSISLIICTLIIYNQVQFIVNKDLGFDKDQVLLVEGVNILDEKTQTFRNRVESLPEVINASISNYLPIEGTSRFMNSFWTDGEETIEEGVNAQIWQVDYDYINTLGLEIVQGRAFNQNMPTDSQSVIITQSMASSMGYDDPLQKVITDKANTWRVIGVIEDFHFESLKEDIYPLCLILGNDPNTLAVKASNADFPNLIESVSKTWKEFAPYQPFRYSFLDESFALMHEDVKRSGNLFKWFAILAIIIACLGLFGLIAYVTEQKAKEVGIRKVLGAGLGTILKVLTSDILNLVFIAFLIGSPIAWLLMSNWLQNFAYKIDIQWWIFALAGLVTLLITVLTISYHCLKAALANPIIALKTD